MQVCPFDASYIVWIPLDVFHLLVIETNVTAAPQASFFVKHESFRSTVLEAGLLVKDGYEALPFLLHVKIKMRNYFTVLLRDILGGKFESKKIYFMLLSDFKCLSKLQK